MNPLDMLKESKCYTCKNRLSRVLEPLTPEDKEYYMEILDIDNTDEYDLYIEQHKCMITDEDIDGVIRECNQYTAQMSTQLIREYKF